METTLIGLLGVVLLDIVLSGDNAVVIALTANRLPAHQRDQAILFGMGGALVLRVLFCVMIGVILALPLIGFLAHLLGGGYLVYVAYTLYTANTDTQAGQPAMTFLGAMCQIVAADVSMSLDNVVAIAGLAGSHPIVMAFGLVVSLICLAVFAKAISSLMQRYAWINYIGAALVAIVGVKMVVEVFW